MVNKHFFKPLLPDFHSHLTIPIAFFSKYMEGRSEHKTAKLRSDASKITWEVKIEDGQKLTDGWKEFALAHNLRIGDIVIFRQEKDMAFHVTLMGPTCCEIQYESCEENNFKKIPRKRTPKREAESSSSLDPSCFLAYVLPSSLRYDALNLPRSFVRANGLETICGEICLENEKGRSWTLALKQKQSGSTYIRRGWRSFCKANGLKTGESEDGDEVESLSTERESDEESNFERIQRKKNPKREAESSSLDRSCFVANVTPSNLRYERLTLPRSFVRANGLETRSGEIVLMNEKGISWSLNLKRKNSCGTMYITRGWRRFCSANGLRAGSFFTFKLIKTGGTLVLRKSPSSTESEEEESSEADEIESLSTESDSEEESKKKEKSLKKPRSIWKASSSSSPSQNRFVNLTLKPFNVKYSKMYLPVPFTRRHSINEETKMSMLDKNGVKWSTTLRSEKNGDRVRLVGGWKKFFKANCAEIGETIMLKLIWEGDISCVLKFCSKVKQETR